VHRNFLKVGDENQISPTHNHQKQKTKQKNKNSVKKKHKNTKKQSSTHPQVTPPFQPSKVKYIKIKQLQKELRRQNLTNTNQDSSSPFFPRHCISQSDITFLKIGFKEGQKLF